jgi:hypothetical protein
MFILLKASVWVGGACAEASAGRHPLPRIKAFSQQISFTFLLNQTSISMRTQKLRLKLITLFILPLFFACLDVHKPLLSDAERFSYDFPGKTQDFIFTIASAVLPQYGYTIAFSDRKAGIIRTAELRMPLNEKDCECIAEGEVPYSKTQKTTSHFFCTLTITEHRVAIATVITREYLPGDPSYFTRTKFTCISKGTVENDIFSKINEGVRSAF